MLLVNDEAAEILPVLLSTVPEAVLLCLILLPVLLCVLEVWMVDAMEVVEVVEV
jgi:hypothetical protein